MINKGLKANCSINYKPLNLFGSAGRTRTCDKVVNSHLLYQLSYRGSKQRPLLNAAYTKSLGPCKVFVNQEFSKNF